MKKVRLGAVVRRYVVPVLGISLVAGIVLASQVPSQQDPMPVVTIEADYPQYDSPSELTSAADAVVTASLIDTRYELLYPDIKSSGGDPAKNPQSGVKVSQADLNAMAVPITVSRVRVERSLEGDLKSGDVIDVKQLGGVTNNVTVRAAGTTLIRDVLSSRSKNQALLFLTRTDQGSYSLVNPNQGLMLVVGSEAQPISEDRTFGDIALADLGKS